MPCIVLAHDAFTAGQAKTAEALLRWGRDPVLAVIDRAGPGTTADEVVDAPGACVPVLGSVGEALELEPDTMYIGVAPVGGRLPAPWRDEVHQALSAGVNVVSGLHDHLGDDPEMIAAADEGGARITDVRRPPDDKPIYSGEVLDIDATIVHTMGTDCSSGKMTTAVELVDALGHAGVSAAFVASGQTGLMIGADAGVVVDAVPADFVAGWAERTVLEAHERTGADVLVVEGQGSLLHPAYAAVTTGLLHGSSPHYVVMCHDASRRNLHADWHGGRTFAVPDPLDMWDLAEGIGAGVREADLLGLSIMRGPYKPPRDPGVPVVDVFDGGAAALAAKLEEEVG